ncbi:MAG: hypothetical protein MR400_07725 [Clostridiales bacterium]|nr:hypothetical protein [Clostridiales bacterium]
MTEQEKRMGNAQKIVLKAMQKTAAVLDDIPDEGLNDRLEWLGRCSEIMLRLSEAMKNVSL